MDTSADLMTEVANSTPCRHHMLDRFPLWPAARSKGYDYSTLNTAFYKKCVGCASVGCFSGLDRKLTSRGCLHFLDKEPSFPFIMRSMANLRSDAGRRSKSLQKMSKTHSTNS
mmetsp:Transcript_62226/g.136254  ORF Transcript_62226/g.136254 Transcript_62226/m.136254 type:complete len:113 (-) Transcript_62226:131-469(-)